MFINETAKYKRDVKRKLVDKHKDKEIERLNNILSFIESKENFKEVLNDNFSRAYGIEQKQGNLKYFFTARINNKLRLYIKPVGDYPYNLIEIIEIYLEQIDDHHYGEG